MTGIPTQSPNDADIELLSAYIDNRISPGERENLEARLGREPALRVALDELRATVALLRELPSVRPPRSFTLDSARATSRRSRFGWLQLAPLGGALAAALLVAVVSLGALQQSSAPAVPMSASVPTSAASALESAPAAPASVPAPPAARAVSTFAPAATQAPAVAEVPAAPAATEAPVAAAEALPTPPDSTEPTAPMAAMATASAFEAPGAASAEQAPVDRADAQVVTPAVSSPDTVNVPPLPPNNPPGAPNALLALVPVIALLVGVGVYLLLRRRG
jgi:hypothetical protein